MHPKTEISVFAPISRPTQNFKKVKIMKKMGNSGGYQDQQKKSGVKNFSKIALPSPNSWEGTLMIQIDCPLMP